MVENDPKDSASIDAIRSHLMHIVSMFKSGDFSAPNVRAQHDTVGRYNDEAA
jgi:hypothetical protein